MGLAQLRVFGDRFRELAAYMKTKSRFKSYVLRIACSGLIAAPCVAAAEGPEDILRTFRMDPAFEIELVAIEPTVFDPVDLEFDEFGRAFVVEMPGYPFPGQPGRVVLLEDADRDGVWETRRVFADGFALADSLLPYNGGILVASPPDLVFLKDTDGDGVADIREVLLTGFAVGNPQHNFCGLNHGLDNWIYGANGGNGGSVRWADGSGASVSLRGADFRVDLRRKRFERYGHTTGGFEITFDDWGRMFGTHNLVHIQHLVFPERYLDGVPVGSEGALDNISDHEEGGLARIFPIGVQETRVNHPEQSGYFSGACGITYYGGGAFPEGFNGSIFVADVVVNLVHRDVLRPRGASFVASRDRPRADFLASSDRAFRPVNMTVGPDGALYLLDMHRDVIEHPEWIPDEIEAKLDLNAGKEQGRIFRIVPKGGLPRATARFDRNDLDAVVAALGHTNKWHRDTAQRLLVEWADDRAVRPLRRLVRDSNNPLARVHALWTLQGLGAARLEDVVSGLNDATPGVRENALQVAEAENLDDGVRDVVVTRTADDDPRVRMQAALTIGVLARKAPEIAETLDSALLGIAEKNLGDPWSRLALASAFAARPLDALGAFLARASVAEREGAAEFAALLGEMGGRRASVPNVVALLENLASDSPPRAVRVAILDGLSKGLETRALNVEGGPALAATAALDRMADTGDLTAARSAWRVAKALGLGPTVRQRELLAVAKEQVLDRAVPTANRRDSLALLEFAPFTERAETLYALLDKTQPRELQADAIAQLSRAGERSVAERLIAIWDALGPAVRGPASDILLYQRANHDLLLTALESGRLAIGELNLHLERRRTLLRSRDETVRKRAEALFTDAEIVTRREAVETMRPALALPGDAANGRAIFMELCANCHRIGADGADVGPNLTDIFRKSPETLLHDIIDPNAAVDTQYVTYAVETLDGRFVAGIIAAESDDSVTIRESFGKETVIPRDQIREMTSDGLSLMPEELEADMTVQRMADLLAFLLEPR